MPFIKKSQTQSSPSSIPPRSVFVGRTNELLFFVQNILKPEEPTYNLLSIWGQGGVGKTTLLRQFKNQAATADFKASCLIAWVDEQQATPVTIMEQFAHQLRLGSTFEKALHRYQEALQFLPPSRPPSSLRQTVVTKTPDLAGSLLEGVPIAGPPLREITKAATEHLLDRSQTQSQRSVVPFNSPLDTLTRVFVTELNRQAEGKGAWRRGQPKHGRKVLLFFDTFEQVADEIVPWLLHSVLELEIHSGIVFVIAGRDPLERSTTVGPKPWLLHYEMHTMHALPLHPFTREETTAYLAERGITAKERIDTIWHLSQGLPLYLGLLTSNAQGTLDPTKDVVDNFLQRIPFQEQTKRQLALDAALFSRPFNLDDLEALPSLSDQDRPALCDWLLRQPFVRASSFQGRYICHDLIRELFQRYLYQHSPKVYYMVRKALAAHYQCLLERMPTLQEKPFADSYDERVEVGLALASQLLFLPEEESHFQSLVLFYQMFEGPGKERYQMTFSVLRDIVQTLALLQPGSHAYRIAQSVLQLQETEPTQYDQTQKDTWLQAVDMLQALFLHSSSAPPEALAHFYLECGFGYHYLQDPQQAQECFERALETHPHTAGAYAYGGLGVVCHELKAYQQAVEHFSRGLQLFPHEPELYFVRGRAYGRLHAYQQALNDLEHAIQLREQDARPYHNRARIYMVLKKYHQALTDLGRAFEVDPESPFAAHMQFERGCIYLHLKNLSQATLYLRQSCELTSGWSQDIFLWVAAWARMCQHFPDVQTREQLKALATGGNYTPLPTFTSSPIQPPNSSRPYIAHVCRGVTFWLNNELERALAELRYASSLSYEQDWPFLAREYWQEWDAHFWLGMTYLALDQEEKARIAIEQALALQMPPILLKPLSWFEREQPKLYEQFVKPLLESYEV
jgi:tetratricopeptide (TPR) repeat protein